MIDHTKFKEIQDKVSSVEKKNYEISGLADFLKQTSGDCTVRVNGRYTFTIPASLLTDYFSAKKAELEGEITTLEAEIKAEVPSLEKKSKGEVVK